MSGSITQDQIAQVKNAWATSAAKPTAPVIKTPAPALPNTATSYNNLANLSKDIYSGKTTTQAQVNKNNADNSYADKTQTSALTGLFKPGTTQNAYAGTQNSELNAAYQRALGGTASQSDYNNLQTAQKKSWQPAGSTSGTGTTGATGTTDTTETTGTDTATGATTTDAEKKAKLSGVIAKGYTNLADMIKFTGLDEATVNKYLNEDAAIASEHKNQVSANTLQANSEDVAQRLKDLDNGMFELNDSERAQVNAMQATYDEIRRQQLTANQNYEGSVTTGEIRSGRQEFMNQVSSGIYKNAVDTGIQKIKNIEAEATSNISLLKQALKDKRYKEVSRLYDTINEQLTTKQNAITSLNKETQTLWENVKKADTQTAAQTNANNNLFKAAIGAMDAYDSKTGKVDAVTVKLYADHFKVDPIVAAGMIKDYYAKGETADKKVDQTFEDKMLSTGYKTINPADIDRMKQAGNDVIIREGRAYMKPGKTTTKEITIGSGKNSYKIQETRDAFGKLISSKRLSTPLIGGGTGGGGNTTPQTKYTPDQKKKLESHFGPDWAKKPRAEQLKFLYPGNSTPTPTGDMKVATDEMTQAVNAVLGKDSFLSPQDHQELRKQWTDNGFAAKDFDLKFAANLNPNNPYYITKKAPKKDN